MPNDEPRTQPGPPWTTLKVLRWTQGFFARRGVEGSARVDAEVLLAHVLQMPRIELYANFDRPMSHEERDAYRALVKRRLAGEPVAYLTGERGFWTLDIMTDHRALIPRPETEHLVEAALDLLRDPARPARAIDIGCGTGAIGLALASERPNLQVFAVDIDPDAVALAAENAAALGLSDQVQVVESDLFAAVPTSFCPVDLVISNPPYVATRERDEVMDQVHDWEPHLALYAGPDGLDVHKRLIPAAGPRLREGGQLIVEIGLRQGPAVSALFSAAGFVEVEVRPDYAGHDRLVIGIWPG